jgi:ParB-like chromosome segregation protein Spo0J
MKRSIQRALKQIRDELEDCSEQERVEAINEIRLRLHRDSPRNGEPVDCVRWVPVDQVVANDYNPNAVAPPEMQLLEHSIQEDGYTQPIVAYERDDGMFEVVDGFHRNRVGRESETVRDRLNGYLPLTVINESRQSRGDRIAATIRHNRARGKHRVDAMSDIVVELKRRNWSDNKIAKELGMDQDEVLRLCQITGLADLFADQEFSRAWDVEGFVTEDDFRGLTEESVNGNGHRTVNTSDPDRIFHRHEDWECFRAGFYAPTKAGVSREQGEEMYRVFLSDLEKFEDALGRVILEWEHSCEHYLTNIAMNRIAWLGQAAMCYATGIPAAYRAGFSLLTEEQQEAANQLALEYLNYWLEAHRRKPVTMEEAYSYDRQSDIY